ncbi:MAG: hypothetical protein WC515_02065 [Candidatus Omnitrophota bacterium]
MIRKTRIWIGATLFLVLAFNYVLIGVPLFHRKAAVEDRARAIIVKQAKADKVFKNSEEEYLLDIFRREKAGLERNILTLNGIGATLVILLASWVAFGLIVKRK